MLSAARFRHGTKVICDARVIDLIMAGDRVTGVRVADGTRYEADTVVNCAGRWTNEASRDAGLHLPLAPTVGFLVFTPPVAASLSRVVNLGADPCVVSAAAAKSPAGPDAMAVDIFHRAAQLANYSREFSGWLTTSPCRDMHRTPTID